VDDLVDGWLTLPDVAEQVGEPITRVRQWIRDGRLVALRCGDPAVLRVPASFIRDGTVLPALPGTLSLLRDCGYGAEEAVRWLFTVDPTLPGTPVEALAAGRRREVRRRAQALAF